MDTVLEQVIGFFAIMISLIILLCIIGSIFKRHGEKIIELENRINKLENKKD